MNKEKPAILIIDMVKDNFDESMNIPITNFAKKIISPINSLTSIFREQGWPVVFSTDAFNKDDFIFSSRMKPHSLAGTKGAEVVDDLECQDKDYWLPKPKFSAFFKTGLDQWLRERDVTLCAVAGIATHFCVLTTVMDAICHDFKAVLLEDCTASYSENIHEQTLSNYRHNPLYPLLRVASSSDLVKELIER
ncbi:MAG: cysteine hydrolase [Desulfobacterales bacterium]|nr:cysteine hydrolase [Desulfobacterales bacterium]